MNKLELKNFLLLFLTNIDETIDISELGFHLGEFANNKRYKKLFRDIQTIKINNRVKVQLEEALIELELEGYLIDQDDPNFAKKEVRIENKEELLSTYNEEDIELMKSLALTYKTRRSHDRFFIEAFGMDCRTYMELDFDSQQRLMKEYHKKHPQKEKDYVIHQIGSGSHSIFIRVKKGTRVPVGSGEHLTFVEAGLTPEEEQERFNKKINNMLPLKQKLKSIFRKDS